MCVLCERSGRRDGSLLNGLSPPVCLLPSPLIQFYPEKRKEAAPDEEETRVDPITSFLWDTQSCFFFLVPSSSLAPIFLSFFCPFLSSPDTKVQRLDISSELWLVNASCLSHSHVSAQRLTLKRHILPLFSYISARLTPLKQEDNISLWTYIQSFRSWKGSHRMTCQSWSFVFIAQPLYYTQAFTVPVLSVRVNTCQPVFQKEKSV